MKLYITHIAQVCMYIHVIIYILKTLYTTHIYSTILYVLCLLYILYTHMLYACYMHEHIYIYIYLCICFIYTCIQNLNTFTCMRLSHYNYVNLFSRKSFLLWWVLGLSLPPSCISEELLILCDPLFQAFHGWGQRIRVTSIPSGFWHSYIFTLKINSKHIDV